MVKDANGFFSLSINNSPSVIDPDIDPKSMQNFVSCSEACIICFQKTPTSMFSEALFEREGVPSSYVCSRFLVDRGNTIILIYVSHDIERLDFVRAKVSEAMQKARILTQLLETPILEEN